LFNSASVMWKKRGHKSLTNAERKERKTKQKGERKEESWGQAEN
jgi:hypothetical protein